ncbi:aldehyde dehydrogenase family protein [Sinorhizobium medicae]|jgi:aldehyde dehydrogenase (NAD+)|uniref:aldehyde dehydrogenase (NAD(+)) n=2 Tax=Sinorhizobium medicae TaxID=110321 RepID=A0A508WYK1_9HYPH|nr:aldehyde dehydrogenase family protein [Sinorhizobium medicae]MBO1941136.1 aldehyde dehydrogenase family protein [Sinorhizobium medicae]MDX0422962.1 aldehyde dehydrogenase family protein [Sinorhizobium medicae]MDX0428571.1 aldehyde dehydrogenase family protein [Sinorhizobium medicae]MDX0440513.1 aldehyde dehydrogenase family protein [Sinorhizobium medicae]MDX0460196.1 aldehyde dehydrogenase family protein [Sinorhizobium medicae]
MNIAAKKVDVAKEAAALLEKMGVAKELYAGGDMPSFSPVTGEKIASLKTVTASEAAGKIERADEAFRSWRLVPAPKRGELVRLLGEELRAFKADLGRLVSIEAGKIPSEGLGEVQEMIDICDFAVGLSRQLYGLTIATERPGHRMMETWHPLGVVGIISAFNFPVAVWSWNAALALVCGDAVVWKPSEKTPLTALACQAILERAIARFGDAPEGLSQVLIGDRAIGEVLVDHPKVPLVSATGSTRMGREVGPRLAKRFARAILELGGNNAGIVCPSADLDMALRAIAFGAMGTAGQRCTTLRRLFVHESVYDQLVPRLKKAYQSVSVGNPLESAALVGPLVDKAAFDGMQKAISEAQSHGGSVTGGERVELGYDNGFYVKPALVEMPQQEGPVLEETFAPILYVMKYSDFDAVLAEHNAVAAGLSSSIFTRDMQEAERFLAADGSDCGIANVNIGTSGAEIGGAFGGEKETGGGRESGSDAWKAYMRRATNTVNYSKALPLAQGVSFDIE